MKKLLNYNLTSSYHLINIQLLDFKQWKIKTCIVLILVLSNNLIFSQSFTCDGIIEVDKNRNIRSSTTEGTYYKLNLTNKSLKTDIFNLTANNSNSACSNSQGNNITSSNDFNIEFLDLNFNLITNLVLNTNQTKSFFVHITIPSNSKKNKWCCTQIIASSKNCDGYFLTTNLQTLLINSFE